MSPDIIKEVNFLISSILLGIIITFTYDWLRICRRLFHHHNLGISIEDFFFWIAASIAAFAMLYTENNGILRWFAVTGAALGMFAYKLLISRYFVQIMVKILGFIGKILKIAGGIIAKPMARSAMRVGRANKTFIEKIRRLLRFVKKKLTMAVKMVKMMLCKR